MSRSRGIYGSNLRVDRYEPSRHHVVLTRALASRIRRTRYGVIHGMSVWSVDGAAVRSELDLDFTIGGNPARYLYVPNGEIWVESWLSPVDAAATMVHEWTETRAMHLGETYSKAHDRADRAESAFRAELRAHPSYVRGYRAAVRAASVWIGAS